MSLTDEIRTVQRLLGVEPDGVAGPRTIEAMRNALDQLAELKAGPRLASATSGPSGGLSAAGAAAGGPVAGNEGMSPSPLAFALIKESEGYAEALPDGRVKAYPDPASGGAPYTIGFGSTGPDIGRGTVWTRAEATARLEADVRKFAAGVARLVSGAAVAATTQGEFDALVSFAYNLGLGALGGSTLLKRHRAGDKAGASSEFAKWDKARQGGVLKPMPGLTKRRAAEAALYRGEIR